MKMIVELAENRALELEKRVALARQDERRACGLSEQAKAYRLSLEHELAALYDELRLLRSHSP
jgi:hypothetical protein